MVFHVLIEVIFVIQTLTDHGFDAYIVGGAVRDILMNSLHIIDYDFTTNATPEEIIALFPESFYENQFGTVSITPQHVRELIGISSLQNDDQKETANKVINLTQATKIHESLLKSAEKDSASSAQPHERNFEITTYRSEGVYTDHRRPESVTWGKTLEEDLNRRDFTINAMAIKLKKTVEIHQNSPLFISFEPSEYEVIDPHHGLDDLHKKLIRTVGDPAARFEEDALRMLRAIRFCVQLQLKMTDEVFAAIAGLAEHIQHISWERIRDEFLKMLISPQPALAIELLDETGLLHFILPELREGKGVEQGGHHNTDVWTHSLDAVQECPSHDPIVRFATLLHDIAKPRTFRRTDHGITFYNHEIIGARMAQQICQRFHLSNKDAQRVVTLVRYHMFYYQQKNTDAAIRRFMRNVGLENINDILDLREGDRLGSGAAKTSWRLEEMKERMIEQLHQPFAITDLAINGHDLMAEFGLKPGPAIGKILHGLFEKVLEHPELNTPKQLREMVKTELRKTT